MKSLFGLFVLLLATLVSALSASGDRLLAIFDHVAEKEGYSQFLGSLENRGFKITYATPKSESLALFELGERTFDHVLFFPVKSKGLGPSLTPNVLLNFVKAEGNILMALSSTVAAPSSLVSLLAELDMQLPADRTGLVVDHFNYDAASSPETHDVLLVSPPGPLRPDVRNDFGAGAASDELLALPRSVAVTLGPGELLAPILRAPPTAYLYNPKEQPDSVSDHLFAAGQQLALVAAMQARNSARVTVVGSAEMLADKWFDAKVKTVDGKEAKTFNREFAKRVSAWAFKEAGVLRVNYIEHHLVEANVPNANVSNPSMYRIKNEVKYSISLSEWTGTAWASFSVPDADELQLEFSMLSPFWRLPLALDPAQSTPQASVYSVIFRLPDQHGIFNFFVEYRRPYLTNVEEKNQVSVRHMAHDEWQRSYEISGAWPWLGGIAVTVVGWLVFCAVWMYSAPTDAKGRGGVKKTQ